MLCGRRQHPPLSTLVHPLSRFHVAAVIHVDLSSTVSTPPPPPPTMQPSASASVSYHDLQPSSNPAFPPPYDFEQFSFAAAYLASRHPPQHLSHKDDHRPVRPLSAECCPPSSASSSLFDAHVHSCLAALHPTTVVTSLAQQYQQELAPTSSSSLTSLTTSKPHSFPVQPLKHEAAAGVGDPSWHHSLYPPIEASVDGTLQERVGDMAPVYAVRSHVTPPSHATWSMASADGGGVVSLSMKLEAAAEPLSVSPSHYPLSRLESGSQCSTDSGSSYQSSLSSAHSPLSPPQSSAINFNFDALHGGVSQASGVPHSAYSAPPAAVPLTAPPPSPVEVFDQPISSLQLPSFIYPTVKSAVSAALRAVSEPSAAVSTAPSAAEKRKTALLDTERRLKHRVIDANRRRRETILVERFAQLSGQRNEPLTRDRVSTLEVACDRYEELIRIAEAMKARMRCMEERLQALDGKPVASEQLHGKRKAAEGRHTVRKCTDVQHTQIKTAGATELPVSGGGTGQQVRGSSQR